MKPSKHQPKRNLLVVVGPDGDARTRLAKGLIQRGNAVVVCDGPPGCSLVRDQRCPIVDTVDGVVIMPVTADGTREVTIGLTLCAREARCALALEPSVVHVMSGSRRLNSSDPDVVGASIERLASGRS